jgi:translocation and assembly module TamB
MKRKVALAFVTAVAALMTAALVALRMPWAGERLCTLAEARVRAATGLRLELRECRVEPFRLEVRASDVRLGPEGAPVFTAEAVRARLAPVQALGRRLELAELTVTKPRVHAQVSPPAGASHDPCPPPLLKQFRVHRLNVDEGSIDLTLPHGEHLTVARVDVRSAPVQGRRGVAALTSAAVRRAGLAVAAAGVHLEAGGRSFDASEVRANADLALDLSRLDLHVATAELPGVSFAASGTVEQLCQPQLDLATSLSGDVAALLALLGRSDAQAQGRLAADVTVTGTLASPAAAGDVWLSGVAWGGYQPGDAQAHLRWSGNELRVDGLEIPATATRGRITARGKLRFGRELGLEAEANLEDVELAEILGRLRLTGAWVTTHVSGKVRVSGTAAPLQLGGEAALDLADFHVLQHSWETRAPGEAGFLELHHARIDAPVRIDHQGVHVEDAKIRSSGGGALTARGVLHYQHALGLELATEGVVDLSELRHLGTIPVGGLLQLEGVTIRAAPYGDPHIEGRAKASAFKFLQLDLGDVAGQVAYQQFALGISGLEGQRGETHYQADLTVDLDGPTRIVGGRYTVRGRLRDAFEAVMPWLPDAVHARDHLDGDLSLRGTAQGRATALDATFEGELGAGQLAGRAFDGGTFGGRIQAGAAVVFDGAELRRGGGVVRAAGRVGFGRPFPWELRSTFDGVALSDLALPGERWEGVASGTATVGGSYEKPDVRFEVHGEKVGVYDAAAGAVALTGRLQGPLLTLTGSTPGVRLTGSARAGGGAPFQARLELDLPDAMRLAPKGWRKGLHARVKGSGTATGLLTDLRASQAELRLDEVSLGYAEFQVEQSEPVVVALHDGRAVVRALALRGVNTQVNLSGAREANGALALDTRGAIDLRLLGDLVPGVVDPRGQLTLEAHVGGTVEEPLLVGTGQLREAGFQLRDLPVAVTGVTGELAFSQNRVIFDHLDATVGSGAAELSGELELERLVPARLHASAVLTEVPLHIPEYIPSVVSGRLEASGTWDAMALSGKLHVLQARYALPVDLERRLLEVPGKRQAAKPFDRAGEWLSLDIALDVDGDTRIENDLVHGTLAGQLTLTGSLASVGMIGTLTMREGARANVRGNDFVLKHAVLDFSDRHKIRMSLDVHGEAQVNDYQVTLHLFGPYEAPTLQLTSQPALSQRDIVTLLSLGYTTRDASAAGNTTGVATAAAAQALFSASGLDSQVRRFAPHGRFLGDINVRITSSYSEALGQVEPRAEFESKLLDERFRLRYQAPLANSRGQRAEAEMRLTPHTSLQYQWDNENPDSLSGGDHGLDLKLRWEWTE